MENAFTEERIRERARLIWEHKGRPHGVDENWFQAECELEAEASVAEAKPVETRTMTAGGS